MFLERELLLPVRRPVDEVLDDGGDDEGVGEALGQAQLPHPAVVVNRPPPIGQTCKGIRLRF